MWEGEFIPLFDLVRDYIVDIWEGRLYNKSPGNPQSQPVRNWGMLGTVVG